MLTVEQVFDAIRHLYGADRSARMAIKHSMDEFRAIESAACAERDARIAELERQLAEARKASIGEPVAWRYKEVAVVDGVRVPVCEVDAARNEYTITQQQPHDWSHLDYPLDYPTYEDYEPLYAITKDKP